MLHVRFIEIVLGLFIVLYALKNCSVHAHQIWKQLEEGIWPVKNLLYLFERLEFVDGFGGRKMGKHEVDAAKEIINLMHKDYKGLEKPRQKPPINNHIPRN
ncbi:hypothetical protein HRI_001298000 [Hibiscus trionum]|uniref:Uncharacterized protein n=1 Tax=Hibiscus trionum TaxID=183268 RepID=A0A9W7HG40_HIBTR|nr:hypothetical protein HRI_001298000 [Hibiscus trionum]